MGGAVHPEMLFLPFLMHLEAGFIILDKPSWCEACPTTSQVQSGKYIQDTHIRCLVGDVTVHFKDIGNSR